MAQRAKGATTKGRKKKRSVSEERHIRIMRRQDPPKFGRSYEPSIKATRAEAPPKASPATVWSELLGRDVHTLSEPERMVLLIDLYLGPQFGLFELQEQRMLPFNPAQHPLFGHPMARGMVLPEFRGTLAVAEELDCARFHPRFVSEEFDEEPTCWVGDILLFLRDGHGPYIVDQDIKDTSSSFELPTIGVTLRTDLSRLMTKERARHKVQEVLYRDVGIPTRRIAGDEVNPILIGNLYQLHAWSRRKASLNASQQEHLLDSLREGMDKGASAWEVLKLLELSHGYPTYHSKIVMYQAIWIQRLRLELLSARLWIDEPMVPEVRRVVDEYGHWFSRGEK